MKTSAPLIDTPEQIRAAAPKVSAWVAASAGTGKTKVLVDRFLNLLLAGVKPQRLLCLTFTKAAAQEMALRLASILREWTTAKEEKLDAELERRGGRIAADDAAARRQRARRLFADVLDTPGGLRIDTIHAFCQSMLRRFPLEANLPPNFQVLDERSATELRQACLEAVLDDARQHPDDELAEALEVITEQTSEQGFAEIVAELLRERGRLKELIGPRGSVKAAMDRLYRRLGLKPGERLEDLMTSACEEAAFAAKDLRRAAQALLNGSVTDKKRGQCIADWLADPAARVTTFDTYTGAYFTKEGGRQKRLATKDVVLAAPDILDVLTAEAIRLEKAINACNAARNAAGTAALVRLGAALEVRYRNAKLERVSLDYDDLILAARDLLKRPGIAPWVLYKLDGGIDHLLIDEAQDTNPEQWEVAEALTGEFFSGETGARPDRTVFAVGDVKQSIYSFQRADPRHFLRMRGHFEERARQAERAWTSEDLTLSFRSTASVLTAVDAVFARPEASNGVSLDDTPIRHQTSRVGEGGLVELWPLIVPAERDAPEPWALPEGRIEEDLPPARLARLIASTIRGWLDRKEMLVSENRPIRPGDIMILVRRRNALVDLTVRELKRHGVAVAGVDRMVLADQLAVMDLIALGRFLLLPEDDLTLATVLKGPLFGFSEERLFELAHGREGHLWPELYRRSAENPDFTAAAQELSELLARVDFVRPYELFAEILGRRGGRRRIVARLGVEAHDPLDEFVAAALSFERSHPPALETFLHWVEAGREEIKRDLESHTRDEVSVMTVHGAKGLQAPIVIMPDTVRMPTPRSRLLWLDGIDGPELPLWSRRKDTDDLQARAARNAAAVAQDAEYRRLLYVAMTRARDRLYVCGYEDRTPTRPGSWYRLIEAGLATVGDHVAFESPDGSHKGFGIRLDTPQTKAVEEKIKEAARPTDMALPEWWNKPPPDEPEPPRPLVPSRPDEDEPPVRPPFDTADREKRFQRGRLIHRLLQSLPDLPVDSRETAAARFLALPAHRLEAAAQDVIRRETMAVLAQPDWAALFGPDSIAEAPIVGRVGARTISGQLDRLVVTDESVLVVDYKTNRPPPLKAEDIPPIYLRQMSAYRAALRVIYPTRRIRCALLWTDGPRLVELPDAVLDRHSP